MKQAINNSRNRISLRWLLAAALVVGGAGSGCTVDEEDMQLEAIGQIGQEVSSVSYPMGAASASDSLPGWEPAHLIDGDLATSYSSVMRPGSDPDGAWVAAWLAAAPAMVDTIHLYARMDGGSPLGFPLQYHVFLTSADNTYWEHVGTFMDPPVDGVVTIEVSPRLTYGVHIVPTILGQDNYGNHYFQLAEIGLAHECEPGYQDNDGDGTCDVACATATAGDGYEGDCPGCGTDYSSWATANANATAACNNSGCTEGCSSSTAAWDNCFFDNDIFGYVCISWCGPEPDLVCLGDETCDDSSGTAQCI